MCRSVWANFLFHAASVYPAEEEMRLWKSYVPIPGVYLYSPWTHWGSWTIKTCTLIYIWLKINKQTNEKKKKNQGWNSHCQPCVQASANFSFHTASCLSCSDGCLITWRKKNDMSIFSWAAEVCEPGSADLTECYIFILDMTPNALETRRR